MEQKWKLRIQNIIRLYAVCCVKQIILGGLGMKQE